MGNIFAEIKQVYKDNEREFQRVFCTQLSKYWNPMFGFDIVKFDELHIKSGDGCMGDKIIADYGQAGNDIIKQLLK